MNPLVVAAIRSGLPPAPLTAAMALERIGMPLAILWYRLVLHQLGTRDAAEYAK